MRAIARVVAFGAGVTALAGVHAEDLGVIGPTYEVQEPHFVSFIENKLREKEQSGELDRMRDQIVRRNTEAVRNPAPVAGLVATTFPRTFFFDPTFVTEESVLDAQGRVLFPSGTASNPLDVVSLSKHLLFFDARDERQVEKAASVIAHYDGKVKPILVGGSFLELMKRWKVQVYYDQGGMLVGRLGVRQVPALVSQEGRRLRVDELPL